jgi:hypothetical protein
VTAPVHMLPCTVCGHELHLSDVVIVSREDRPPWASPREKTMTAIAHRAREPREGRADYNRRQEPPQTLLHALPCWLIARAAPGDLRTAPVDFAGVRPRK